MSGSEEWGAGTQQNEEEIRERVRQTFEAIAEHFNKTRYRPWPETVEYVESLPEHCRILDIGCGNGRNSVMAVRYGHEVVGIDSSLSLARIARDKLARRLLREESHFLVGDACLPPVKEGSFDAALYIATLHHIPSEEDRLRSLIELHRCLKPEGTALISVWALDQPRFSKLIGRREKDPSYADIFLPWTRSDGEIFQRYYHLFEKDELRDLVIRSGLIIEKYFKSRNNYFARVRRGA
ncbi:MAG: class I SAM-dependent methyltransferase [Thermoplasmata archaeon]